MPYRDDALALEHKLRMLREERRAIDASIEVTAKALCELRRSSRLFSWSEIVITVALVGLVFALCIIGAVIFACIGGCRGAQQATARADASMIADSVIQFIAEKPDAGCPTMESLVKAEFIYRNRPVVDPWQNEFRIDCAGDDITVISAGRDGLFGTEDDLSSDGQ